MPRELNRLAMKAPLPLTLAFSIRLAVLTPVLALGIVLTWNNARADDSKKDKTVLEYKLSPKTTLTFTLHEKGFELSINDDRLPCPISTWGENMEVVTLPLPDRMPTNHLSRVTLDPGDFLRNLNEDGKFAFRVKTQGGTKTQIHVVDVKRSVQEAWRYDYHFEEPPKTPGFNQRHISFKTVRGVAGGRDLLVSIADVDEQGNARSVGTILTDQYGQYHRIDSDWHDFSALGGEFQIKDDQLFLDGRRWRKMQTMGTKGSEWVFPGMSEEARTFRFSEEPKVDRKSGRTWSELNQTDVNPTKIQIEGGDGKSKGYITSDELPGLLDGISARADYDKKTAERPPSNKIVIAFNPEGEDPTFKLVSPELERGEAWRKPKSPIMDVLKNYKGSDPLLATVRFKAILFKPLDLDERMRIAHELSTETAKRIRESYGVDVEFSQDFNKKMAESFFSEENGVRKLKIPTSSGLFSLLEKPLAELRGKPDRLAHTKLLVDLNSTASKDVHLTIKTQTRGAPEKTFTEDVTPPAHGVHRSPSSCLHEYYFQLFVSP